MFDSLETWQQLLVFLGALLSGGGLTHFVKESHCVAGEYRIRYSLRPVDTGEDLDGDGKNDIEQRMELGIVKMNRKPAAAATPASSV